MVNSVEPIHPKVLVVDDNKKNLYAIRVVLEDSGMDILEAQSGEEALRIASELELALILLDVQMPGMDGFEVAELLRKNKKTKAIPIIFVTAISKETKFIHKGHELGAVDYIFKPIDPQILTSKVKVFLDYYLQNKMMNNILEQLKKTKNELEMSNQQLTKLARVDRVTGLSNRLNFEEYLDSALIDAKNNNKLLAVLYMDLDDFKCINDTYGHDKGDELLKEVSKRIKSCIRSTDIINTPDTDSLLSRLGGDEFSLVLTNILSPLNAGVIANRIIKAVSGPILLGNDKAQVGISIGIACYPSSGATAEQLIKAADQAMYKIKAIGKNNFQYYVDALNKEYHQYTIIDNNLRSAIKNKELSLAYQPIVEIKSKNVVSCEVLCRWNNNELGMVIPDKFIHVAEETDYIHELGKWIFNQTVKELDTLIVTEFPTILFHINLSIKQLEKDDFFKFLEECFIKAKLKQKQVVFELTESALMNKSLEIENRITHLCQLGCKISLDNFGTGYSSLSRLKKLPLTSIKLDTSLVNIAIKDKDTKIILKSMVELAHTLQIHSIAEGVENDEQLSFLKEIGCDLIQGHIIAKPMSCKELQLFLLTASIKC